MESPAANEKKKKTTNISGITTTSTSVSPGSHHTTNNGTTNDVSSERTIASGNGWRLSGGTSVTDNNIFSTSSGTSLIQSTDEEMSMASQIGKSYGKRSRGKFGLGGHLNFHKMLGEGSEGQTWSCEDLATKEMVAVKVIERLQSLEQSRLQNRAFANMKNQNNNANSKKRKGGRKFNPGRVAAEIIMQCALNHDNLVQLKAVYMSSTHIGLVMELVGGGEVYTYVKKHPVPERVLFPFRHNAGGRRSLPRRERGDDRYVLSAMPQKDDKYRKHLDEERSLYLFKQVLSGVAYCHRHHIAHRDLKLTNVLIDNKCKPPRVKICDFGLSKHWLPPEKTDSHVSLQSSVSDFEKQSELEKEAEESLFARCRTRVGSPMYVAREIVSRDFCMNGYDGTAVDVWSMGVMLYYMLRGKFPFPDFNGKGSMEILRRIPSNVKTDLLKNDLSKSELSDEAKDLLHKMLRFDVSQRIRLEEIYEHPWVTQELPDERVELLFSEIYSKKYMRAVSGDSGVFTNMFDQIRTFFQTNPFNRRREMSRKEYRHKSRSHSTAIDDALEENDLMISNSSSHTEDISADLAELQSAPSGKSFPSELWLQVKEMVYRGASMSGNPRDRVEIWRPPFGPFRLTISPNRHSDLQVLPSGKEVR
eukprot:CAMPEP_0197484628 /NCGR_PEP_ID=MMETSP1309-20131121/57500_1 /TAXON_ID=464262 /ORGANISM="Genus nov. species nov., Strain RCC998" /LENGTH=644 /DNA_ID=CAMNT_0043027271 /DNA_START=174 /DNA_END=2108 /DNA_ORIENTATION=-